MTASPIAPRSSLSQWGAVHRGCAAVAFALVACCVNGQAFAQSLRGGEVRIPVAATGEERTAQSDLWVLEVNFKPMRQIPVEITDPKTGVKKTEYVWYICYRAFNRELSRRDAASAGNNESDPQVISPPLFVPQFTLITDDDDTPLQDQIIPEAIAVINAREKGKYRSSVDLVGPLPPPSSGQDTPTDGLWGVATWRGIDPRADGYTVYASGFSNGIQLIDTGAGEQAVQNKTIKMRYVRPGDEFDQAEPEIRLNGDPEWIYR